MHDGKIIEAIYNGAYFLAKHGFLNSVKHTGYGVAQLRLWGGENYTNSESYVHEQAAADGVIVTANGSGVLFTKELLLLLEK